MVRVAIAVRSITYSLQWATGGTVVEQLSKFCFLLWYAHDIENRI
jgi:hypothetical protein